MATIDETSIAVPQEDPPASVASKCPACRAGLPPGARFCNACGGPVA